METTKVTTKVILIGRHASDLPADIEVVAQENILWATTREECLEQFKALIVRASEMNAAILLQNVPGILAIALATYNTLDVKIGVIISVPGTREASVVSVFETEEPKTVENAVLAANGRARLKWEHIAGIAYRVTVTVDPVTPFVFSHIEWM